MLTPRAQSDDAQRVTFGQPNALAPKDLLEQIEAARSHALTVLGLLGAHASESSALTKAMVAIQEAANRLGVAEAVLAKLDQDHPDVPAPILTPDDPVSGGETIRWSGEARAVMALAEFTVPYAHGAPDEIDRWLRVLRREGAVGRALADLNFPPGELAEQAAPATASRNLEPLHAVSDKAVLLARHRGAEAVTTTDLLFATLAIYGGLADRALYQRGISRPDLLRRLTHGVGARAATLPA